jgi:hypothetical protein
MRKWTLAIAVVPALAAAALVVPSAGAVGNCPAGSTDPSYCPAPVVTTGTVTSVTSTSATLTGSINGQGAANSYTFLYGTTTSYGSKTPTGTLPGSTSAQAVSATVTGLQPSTTYHFTLFAINQASQAGAGKDVQFTTSAVTPPPTAKKKRPKLTIKAKPKHDATAPFKFTFSGTVRRPTGVTKAAGCKGTVTIKVRRGSKVVKSGKAKVSTSCTYKKKLSVPTSKLLAKGSLKASGAFGGNAALLTASKSTTVRYG